MLPNTAYLDLETTGFSPIKDEIVSIALLLDTQDEPLMHTLVRPTSLTEWPEAQQIHGISPDDVIGAPTMGEITRHLSHRLAGLDVVIYNKRFDARFIPGELSMSNSVMCCMEHFAHEINGGRKMKLIKAAEFVGYDLGAEAHTALGDVRATRAVWRYLMVPQERERIDTWREQEDDIQYG